MSQWHLDIEALSGIAGSMSIACWIVVFSPQIIENFKRSSTEAISTMFLVIWTAGDLCNFIGGVLQGVLPTMIILAIYYCLVDVVLLGQVFWYRGFHLKDHFDSSEDTPPSTERSALLQNNGPASLTDSHTTTRPSSNISDSLKYVDGTHLSPATPLHASKHNSDSLSVQNPLQRRSVLQNILFNLTTILLVCAAGILGWYISERTSLVWQAPTHLPKTKLHNSISFNITGQAFGYLCAVLYLGSRVPQLMLNHRRKSTDGISMLFFIFACIGNVTYVLSIFLYEPRCRHLGICQTEEASREYWRYIAVNFSWLLGSFGTLCLDMGVFVQYFLYKDMLEDSVPPE